ncbi:MULTISPECIES: extracellular solute-binding protein [unclassified Brenneria]|uniref:extracellular solute-binding protein n=1 Tax=unclassified Brenneria TaxID=2634434 RepID=UPI0018F08C81|nr:extracellular solute-binding protein [Brenneria sp. L3-3C-1]MBJ7220963.1 extracellular solute-binding protein [Brenneria sp. L3-3C-1]MEE3642204.1 extracellular solute-binding protein [Brenneria sp. L3_3C_1]
MNIFIHMAMALCLAAPVSGIAAQITAWVIDGAPERPYFAQLEQGFNQRYAAQGISIKIKPIPGYNDALQAAWMSNDLPDLVMIDGPNMASYIWSGMLQPLDPFIAPEVLHDFLDGVIAQGTYSPDKHVYMLSQGDSSVVLWGNKRYLEAAGIPIPTRLEDAWDYAQFSAVLAKLAALPEVKWPLDFKLNYSGEWLTYGYYPFIRSAGGDLIDQRRWRASGTLDGPATVAAVEKLKHWQHQRWLVPATAGDNRFFGDRSAALSWVGNWMWETYHQALGDDLVLIPAPRFGRQAYAPNGSWGWAVPVSTTKRQEVSQFLNYLFSARQIKTYCDFTGYVPARRAAIALMPAYAPGGALSLLTQQASHIALVRPVHPAYPVISGEFGKALKNSMQGADSATALKRAAAAIDRDIDDNMGYPPFNGVPLPSSAE